MNCHQHGHHIWRYFSWRRAIAVLLGPQGTMILKIIGSFYPVIIISVKQFLVSTWQQGFKNFTKLVWKFNGFFQINLLEQTNIVNSKNNKSCVNASWKRLHCFNWPLNYLWKGSSCLLKVPPNKSVWNDLKIYKKKLYGQHIFCSKEFLCSHVWLALLKIDFPNVFHCNFIFRFLAKTSLKNSSVHFSTGSLSNFSLQIFFTAFHLGKTSSNTITLSSRSQFPLNMCWLHHAKIAQMTYQIRSKSLFTGLETVSILSTYAAGLLANLRRIEI